MNYERSLQNTKQSVSVRRILSGLTEIIGGLILTITLSYAIVSKASIWSPTACGQDCFYYPNLPTLPDTGEIGQELLSRSFFGNDALYFDFGAENTRETKLPSLPISDGSGLSFPEDSLEAPEIRFELENIYSYDYSKLKKGEIPILPFDLSGKPSHGEVLLSNTTSYKINPLEYINKAYPIADKITKAPLVLIVHTHGTEAFVPEGTVSIEYGSNQRSNDTNENIVAVGAVMSELLNEADIPTIHCEIMHDLNSYRDSYNLSSDTVQKYLTKYPSIKYVFDVHRDAVIRQNGDIIRPICAINNELTAQIMLLVGTNEGGADHRSWEDNLTVALKLQKKLTEKYEAFARPVNIRSASFNQQSAKGSLLIEIGSSGNTLNEAKQAAKILTYSLIELIRENQK